MKLAEDGKYVKHLSLKDKQRLLGSGTGPVFLYGCETWSHTEKHILRVFPNMVLRKICGPERDEVTGEWRELHNEELNDLYYSPNTVRVSK